MNGLRFAYDVTEIRPGAVGGVEYATYYMLDGFLETDLPYEMDLLVTEQNEDHFQKYASDSRITLVRCYKTSESYLSILHWICFGIKDYLRKSGVSVFYSYTFYRPPYRIRSARFINTIHDMMIRHYPSTQPWLVRSLSHIMWHNAVKYSQRIGTSSDYSKSELISAYPRYADKFYRIYIAVLFDEASTVAPEDILDKFGVKRGEFYYSISRLYHHKNYMTLVEVMKRIKEMDIDLPKTLLLTAGKAGQYDEIVEKIEEYGLQDSIRFTGYVTEDEKDVLLANCRAFLFPSVFEGYGMGLIEAMAKGATVITTRETCIPEVTQSKANYVRDPYSVDEWIELMRTARENGNLKLEEYAPKTIAEQVLAVIDDVAHEPAR